MKLWDKGFTINDKIEKFTVGKDRELDAHLAKYDALASKAQANMLAKTGLITNEENDALQIALDEVLVLIAENNFEVDENFEDIHSKIEAYLIEKTGDAGKKIHVARSRNDQVLVAIQLFKKEYLKHTTEKIVNLIEIFLQKADEFKNHQLPGYTHFQAAMPSSFGMWFSAYAESLLTDLYFFEAAYKISDQNPLGSGAGFGTSFPIDRLQTTQELGFSEILVSSVGAQMLRGKTEKSVATALAMICGTLSKMSYDLVLYNSQDLAFVKLPNEMTTGSSIMPHKKNPDVFELTRAHCNRIQALPNDIMMTINNLPSGYHRDYQILKEILFEPMMQFDNIIDILTFAIPQLQIKDNYMNQDKYDPIYTVENINEAIKNGTPFRDAYKEVGLSVENGTYIPHKEFQTSHIGSIHNLRLDLISNKIEKFKLEAQVLK
ncbi:MULTISPECIES: argininosuccinate lyase [Empedobacter]|uniref:argininosuccinate lyase n=1 Tax=Empedobacter TaxID=59734 RepID=UPI001C577457|nr:MULTISPECIES: argininosuccinate lyase [Empedobacter]MBW1618201.1 argininosuccinate lyase [Empedobacter falsenii]MDH0658644.1 argininosuccinate lyase [Empedobacter sp. GD03865]MDM1138454.1 argininosuccinate lyase [Empedobacter sp. R132-2]